MTTPAPRNFISIADVSRADLERILDLAVELKAEWKESLAAGRRQRPRLDGLTLAMLFEKPSLRTRVSFEAGMFQLGGHAINLEASGVGRLGQRESISDLGRNLARWCQIVQGRVFDHSGLVELAKWCDAPIVNGLSDLEHPTQVMADYLTIREATGAASFDGLHLGWIGDGNNVSHSLMLMAAHFGHAMTLAIPEGYDPAPSIVEACRRIDPSCGDRIRIVRDPMEAARAATVLYTDVWASMGQEGEAARREAAFAGYQINEELLAAAPEHAFVLHDLPAKRGKEITDGVLDGPRCRAFDQAENRLHTIKAILCWCLGAE